MFENSALQTRLRANLVQKCLFGAAQAFPVFEPDKDKS